MKRGERKKMKKLKLIRFDCDKCLVTFETKNRIYQWRFYPCTLEGLIAEMRKIEKFLQDQWKSEYEKRTVKELQKIQDKFLKGKRRKQYKIKKKL